MTSPKQTEKDTIALLQQCVTFFRAMDEKKMFVPFNLIARCEQHIKEQAND